MKIYLLRHGKSEEHEKQTRQHPGSDLGSEGKKQAKKAAMRLKVEPIEVIISSPWPRALTTAKIVAKAIKLPVTVDEGVHEIIQNPILNNLPYDHELTREFIEIVKKEGRSVDWKFCGGGESIRDVLIRARKFKADLLKKYAGKNVLIVSHGYFLSGLVSLFLAGDGTDDQILRSILVATLSYENTGLSLIEYVERVETWKLMYFNDSSHLKKLSGAIK